MIFIHTFNCANISCLSRDWAKASNFFFLYRLFEFGFRTLLHFPNIFIWKRETKHERIIFCLNIKYLNAHFLVVFSRWTLGVTFEFKSWWIFDVLSFFLFTSKLRKRSVVWTKYRYSNFQDIFARSSWFNNSKKEIFYLHQKISLDWRISSWLLKLAKFKNSCTLDTLSTLNSCC